MKLVILVVAIALLLWLVFGRRRGRRDAAAPPRRPPKPPKSSAEGMVACAHCGVHLPRSEALVDGARLYCSAAHRLAGPHEPPAA